MKPDHRNALQLALNRSMVDADKSTRWAFYNACPLPDPDDDWKQAFSCWQTNRSEFLRLTEHGYTATHELTTVSERSGNAAFLLGRNRLWNQWVIARAWNRLGKGGRLIVAGNKNDGIGPLRRWLSQHVEIAGSFSKYHAVVFWADKTHDQPIDEVCLSRTVDGYEMAEGLFSASGPDSGSQLLAEHLNDRIRGKVADLGSGWGYLSGELLKRSNRVDVLDLYEADHEALEYSKKNVASGKQISVDYHWCDVTREFEKKPYDWVIMNPPFHTGRAADTGLGQRFIEVAASTLPRGGRLLLVANRNLPYERGLAANFRGVEKLAEQDGFKVIEAVR